MMHGKNAGTDETWKLIPQGSVGVEIGVWKGDSSVKFLKRASHLHLVDPWSVVAYEDSDEFGSYASYLNRYSKLVGSSNPADFQKFYDNVYKAVQQKLHGMSVTFHRCTSQQFFAECSDNVDWVYIDGLHNYDGCLADLRGAQKIVKRGGFIFGDDYGNKAGVVKAVDQFIEETTLPFDNFYKNQYCIHVN